jgi:hypothetical protein
MMLTSGSLTCGGADATASLGSLHPASTGASPASRSAKPAERAFNIVIYFDIPSCEFEHASTDTPDRCGLHARSRIYRTSLIA